MSSSVFWTWISMFLSSMSSVDGINLIGASGGGWFSSKFKGGDGRRKGAVIGLALGYNSKSDAGWDDGFLRLRGGRLLSARGTSQDDGRGGIFVGGGPKYGISARMGGGIAA